MSVAGVVLQLKQDRGGDAFGAVAVHTELQRKTVGIGEGSSNLWLTQNVRVFFHNRKSPVAVQAIQTDRELRLDPVSDEKLHQTAQSQLPPQHLAHLHRLFHADAFQPGQLFRLTFHDIQSFCAECRDDH